MRLYLQILALAIFSLLKAQRDSAGQPRDEYKPSILTVTQDEGKQGVIRVHKKGLIINVQMQYRSFKSHLAYIGQKDSSKYELVAIDTITKKEIDLKQFWKDKLYSRYPDTMSTPRMDTIDLSFHVVDNKFNEIGTINQFTKKYFYAAGQMVKGKQVYNDFAEDCYKYVMELSKWKDRSNDKPVRATCNMRLIIGNYNFVRGQK